MKELLKLYNKSPTIEEWAKKNKPNESLIYKGGVASQEQMFSGISCLIRADLPRVVSYHTSKSVQLPVVAYFKEIKPYDVQVLAFIRDNFYDLNCTIMSNQEMDMNIREIYSCVTKEWLEEERVSNLKYTARTAFDIPDCSKDIKERSLKSYRKVAEDPGYDWYSTDWSSAKIIQHNGEYFKSNMAFWEGNPGTPINSYDGTPRKDFTFTSGSYAKVAQVIEGAMRAAENAGYKLKGH